MLTQACLFFLLGNQRPVINASDFSNVKNETLGFFTGGVCVVRIQGHLFLFSRWHFELKWLCTRRLFEHLWMSEKIKPCACVCVAAWQRSSVLSLHQCASVPVIQDQLVGGTAIPHRQWAIAAGRWWLSPQAFLAAPQTGLCAGGEMRGLRITDCGQMSRYSLVRCGREGGEGDRTIFTAVKCD